MNEAEFEIAMVNWDDLLDEFVNEDEEDQLYGSCEFGKVNEI